MRKRAKLLATFTIASALAASAAAGGASAAVLTYACEPPSPRAAANCDIWHTASVELRWSWDIAYDPDPTVSGNDCSTPHTFDADTAETRVRCVVSNATDTVGLTATIRIDKTPPAVTGFTPDRPPDHDGWWNHPVSLQFNGIDATSGVAACDVVSYSGPDGASAPVAGGCSDVAGNTASGTFPLKYDATPPTVGALPSETEVGYTTLHWTTSSDAVQTRIVRSPGIGTAPASEVYSGPDHIFTDTGVTGGRAYTYSLTASDAAANAASTNIAVTAKPAPQASPAATRRIPRPPRLRWRRVRSADYYNVQLFRGDRKILSRWPHLNHLQLRRTWTFHGRKRELTAGSYHWYVWPGFGLRSKHRYGKLIAHRRFKIASGEAAR